MEYDYIIIGAGISGLYTAYLIKKHKNSKILILEANNYIGGRMGTDNFYSCF
jgi:protoporphyrinogen oxidase